MKITKKLAQQVEDALKAQGYKIIYEKGTFQSGYCLLDSQMIIVINKFYTFESRVAALIEALCNTPVKEDLLEPEQLALIQQLRESANTLPNAA